MSRPTHNSGFGATLKRARRALRFRFDRWQARRGAGANGERADLAGRFCLAPFQQVDLEESGTCYTCCSSWLPTPMGNVGSVPLVEMWNGPVMRKVRESIYDGSFRYCRHDRCPLIQNDSLMSLEEAESHPRLGAAIRSRATTLDEPPVVVNMVNDRSCNLWCPSCRTERINHREGDHFDQMAAIQERFLAAWLETPNDRDFTLNITGSGDPFASRVYRELLYGLDGSLYPNMKIALQTNGVLLTPRNWARMKGIHGNISSILVSLDAATPETYAQTRRGGHWRTLMENCGRLGELRAAGEIRFLRYDFVAQKANFSEIPAFVGLARKLGGDRAYLSRLIDWGTWPRSEFLEQSVWEEGHDSRDEFLEVMRHPALDDPFVDLGNLSDLHEEARARSASSG